MAKRTKIIFVVNPISGTSDKKHIIDLIPKYMNKECFEWAIRKTEYRGHAAKLVDEAIEENADVVVTDTITTTKKTTIKNIEPIETATIEQQILKCPKCNSDLILRTATRGANAGKQFYGCSNFPKCKYIQNII